MLSLKLLGPLLVQRDNQTVTGFESARVRALLLYLAVEARRPHQRDALCGLLWPEQPNQVARNNLRQALSNLRQAIQDHTAQPPFLLISRATLQLNPASQFELDVATFRELIHACTMHAHRRFETCVACAERLMQAVELYRGPFLAEFFLNDNVVLEEWIVLQREALQQQAIMALSALVTFHERRGNYELACSYAQRQLELDPWREEAHRQLMHLLMLRGERSAALTQYEACRRVLALELGVEPGAETNALYEQLSKPSATSLPSGPQRLFWPCQPGALPVQPTAFVGRETELAELSELLENPACRLISIVGAHGIGKTRLAVELAGRQAHSFASGVVFVPLSGLDTPELLVAAIAGALQLTPQPPANPLLQLLEYLRGQESLLILDDLTQSDDAARLLERILRNAPQVTLLATAYEPLGLSWEWVFDLTGLSYPTTEGQEDLERFSAVRLFVQRARQRRRHFVLDHSSSAAIAQICWLASGLPLEVEWAAAAVREQTLEQIAEQLRQRCRLA